MKIGSEARAFAVVVIVLTATTLIVIGGPLLLGTPSLTELVPRYETVWVAGFDMDPAVYNPWNQSSSQGWTTYLMYEPMFGTNVATGKLIKWLGKSIAWGSDNRTIVITLRNTINWTSVGSNLVSNSTPITTDDVYYTFQILQQQGQLGSLVQRIGRINSTSFEIVNATVLKVHILPAYAGSNEVMRQLTYSWLIMPKAVWQDINTTYAGVLGAFSNDWTNTTTVPAKWKVASGMYLPYWHNSTTTIAVRNNDWWGKNDRSFSRLPYPMYVGYTVYANDDLAVLALEHGDLDWYGGPVAHLETIMSANHDITTYFQDKPYLPDESVDLLVPNHMNYPLNQTWLHKALVSVLNYTEISSILGGYLKKPSPMLIPADDAVARQLLNASIEAKYADSLNVSKGLEILSTYCTYDAATEVWWTKEGVTPGDPVGHYPLAEWPGRDDDNHTAPWRILSFHGWSNACAVDEYAAGAFTSLLSIRTELDQGIENQWGVVQTKVNGGDFDLYHHAMSGELNMNMYERYFQMFSTKSADAGGGISAPLGGWQNSTFDGLIDQLDLSPAGSQSQRAIANRLQEILGQVMPVIPLSGHPRWQVYSYYAGWVNWPDSEYNPMLSGSPSAGAARNANVLSVVFGLTRNPVPSGGAVGGELDFTQGYVIVGVAVTVTIAIICIVVVLDHQSRSRAAVRKERSRETGSSAARH